MATTEEMAPFAVADPTFDTRDDGCDCEVLYSEAGRAVGMKVGEVCRRHDYTGRGVGED